MSNTSWQQNFMISGATDGPALTAAAAASCLPQTVNCPRLPFPGGLLKVNDILHLTASGRISCAVTTPGTARWDLRFGSTVIFDTLAIPLNVVAQTNVPWWLDVLLYARTVGAGTAATFFGMGTWSSGAGVGAAAPASGGGDVFVVPYNTAPVVGGGFDSTISNAIDFFFTQTVATGSMTLHTFRLAYET
jgi:hypothetical protein